MHVGIIGGGIMGLATAFYLGKKGHQVTVLEKEKEVISELKTRLEEFSISTRSGS